MYLIHKCVYKYRPLSIRRKCIDTNMNFKYYFICMYVSTYIHMYLFHKNATSLRLNKFFSFFFEVKVFVNFSIIFFNIVHMHLLREKHLYRH